MFETHDSAEEYIPSEFTINGLRAWNCVHSRLHVPWLHAVYVIKASEGYVPGQIAFLTYVDQLLQLDQQSNTKILEVNLVSPDHVNNKGAWKMDPLKEIWVGYEPDTEHQQETEIFVLKDGNRYTYSPLSTDEENILEKKLVFKI